MSRLPGLLLACLLPLGSITAEDERGMRQLLGRYCLACHAPQKKKADLDLESIARPGLHPDHDEHWEQVRVVLGDHSMPPEGKPQPTPEERDRLAAWIDQSLSGPAGDQPSDPGWVAARRLTRLEFANTIRDLLGVAIDAAQALPPDNSGGGGGFDNDTEVLFVTPLLMERLLDATLSAVAQAKPERLGIVTPEPDKTGAISATARRKAVEASLLAFLPRAWRRPVAATEAATYVKIYERAMKRGVISHDDALRLAYAATLVSSNFLLRMEINRPGSAPYPLTAHELATRLSYFLWATMPDAELRRLADEGRLQDATVLVAQAERLLKDRRSQVFIRQFVSQWLGTADLAEGRGPEAEHFRDYTESLRRSLMEEPVAFLRGLFADNRSLLDLIDSDYVWVDGELARHYGLSAPGAKDFVRVPVGDSRRGGLVTMGGVLAVTSRPSRTSPVLRGKWILDELLSAPPPPPPPDAPDLPESGEDLRRLTLRQRMERHREDPACVGCHQRIDPLGLGLENFDALGRWRTRGDHGEPLDTLGTLPGGVRFDGPAELKAVLMARKERIMTTVVERMLSYALGRRLERHDRPTVRVIMQRLAADGWRARTLISEIVTSLPFRQRRAPTAVAVPAISRQTTP